MANEATVLKLGSKWRVVDPATRQPLMTPDKTRFRDGGGFQSKTRAVRMASSMNRGGGHG